MAWCQSLTSPHSFTASGFSRLKARLIPNKVSVINSGLGVFHLKTSVYLSVAVTEIRSLNIRTVNGSGAGWVNPPPRPYNRLK